MKTMKRYLLTLVAMAVCGTAVAQESDFSENMTIEKVYELEVTSAERMEVEIERLDTLPERPKLNYMIFPTPHAMEFSVKSLKPISMSTAQWSRPAELYLNVGGGWPWQSEADLYWTPIQNRASTLSVALNHEGSEGRVTGYDGERTTALLIRNQLGVNYSREFSPLTRFNTSVNYRGSLGSYYGGVGVAEDVEREMLSVHDVEARANLAGRFSAKSPLGYDANLMGLYAFNNLNESVWRFNVNFGLLGLDRIKGWLPSKVTLHYSGVQSVCQSPYFDTSVTFVPEWNFRIGRWIPVGIVAGYDYMVYKGANNTLDGVITTISVAFDRYKVAVPYLTVANDVQTQVTQLGLWNNPFMSMLPVDVRKVFLAELGVRGEVADVTYKLSGATRWFSSYFYEVVEERMPTLAYGCSNGQRVWYADAEALWRPSQNFSLEGRLRYVALGKAEEMTDEFSPRNWRARVEAQLRPISRLMVALSGEWASAMSVTLRQQSGASLIEMPSYVDLGLKAEWQQSEEFYIWLRGDNLLNQPIYTYAAYKGLGAGFRAGVRISF